MVHAFQSSHCGYSPVQGETSRVCPRYRADADADADANADVDTDDSPPLRIWCVFCLAYLRFSRPSITRSSFRPVVSG